MNVLGPSELRSVITSYRDALRAHQARLNRLNVYPVPDGDTGTNMALTVESVVAEMGSSDDMQTVCKAISHGSLMGARGNSGVILCQVLRGLTDRIKTEDNVDGVVLAEALAAASAAAYQAVMKPVEGTILTVVHDAADAAQVAAKEPGATLLAVLEAAREAGCDSLARTPELLPVLKEAGVVDAGGAGFLLLLDTMLHTVDGRPVPESTDEAPVPVAPAAVAHAAGTEPETDLRYEVMFFLEAPDESVEGFKAAWAGIGDSIVVVGGDGVWNCHIHTDDAGAAIEAGIDVGRPRSIRITDLAEQIEHERCVREEERAGTAVVAVGAGAGAVAILKSLGVSVVVAGGQSMNPSTAELLDAIQATPAAEVVVLPNNRNVIPVAEQAREMATKKDVRIVPTESLAEGFAALIGFDPDAAAAANEQAMADAADEVQWGEVTWAVRDATTPAGPVKEGDHIGLLGHDIVVINADLADTCCSLLAQLVGADHELVTVVEGQAASAEATQRIGAWLAEQRPGATVEVHRGDQPLSAYLFSAE